MVMHLQAIDLLSISLLLLFLVSDAVQKNCTAMPIAKEK